MGIPRLTVSSDSLDLNADPGYEDDESSSSDDYGDDGVIEGFEQITRSEIMDLEEELSKTTKGIEPVGDVGTDSSSIPETQTETASATSIANSGGDSTDLLVQVQGDKSASSS